MSHCTVFKKGWWDDFKWHWFYFLTLLIFFLAIVTLFFWCCHLLYLFLCTQTRTTLFFTNTLLFNVQCIESKKFCGVKRMLMMLSSIESRCMTKSNSLLIHLTFLLLLGRYTNAPCLMLVYSTQFANVHNFKDALCNLEFVKLQPISITHNHYCASLKLYGNPHPVFLHETHTFAQNKLGEWGCSWAVTQSSILIFWDRFARVDWHSVPCRVLQNTVTDNRCLCDLCPLHSSSVHQGLSSVYTVYNSRFKIGLQFLNYAAQVWNCVNCTEHVASVPYLLITIATCLFLCLFIYNKNIFPFLCVCKC